MGTIHHLPDILINKIAAGEVIERPVYILKELLDNAIDASAQTITVKLHGYGLESIQVIDDGIGMSREDIKVAYLRHTTSKIYDEDDLHNIQSFGFRGEALASIAAVCRLSITSRTAEDIAGYRLVIENSQKKEERIIPMPPGTDILVSNIFLSIPARRKFLRSDQTEYRQILALLYTYALSFPTIRFDISHNNKPVATHPATKVIDRRLEHIIPPSIFSNLIPLSYEQEYVSLHGYTSKPQLSYKTTKQYHLFLNNRPIQDTLVADAIKEAYGTLLSPLEYPYIILYLDIPHHLVDVNVHPRKEEVAFVHTKEVCKAVYDSIVSALSTQNLRFFDKRWQNKEDASDWQLRDGGTQTYAADVLRKRVLGSPTDFSDKNVIQIHNLYILLQSQEGVLVVDQHAAHERILYERFMKAYKKGITTKNIHIFETPVSIDLSPLEKETAQEFVAELAAFGIQFQITQDGDVLLQSVPDLVKDRDVQELMREILEMCDTEKGLSVIDSYAQKMITYLACRSAIKAGDVLTKKQIRELLHELKDVENPYTCPHGRPLQVVMDLKSINRMFKR